MTIDAMFEEWYANLDEEDKEVLSKKAYARAGFIAGYQQIKQSVEEKNITANMAHETIARQANEDEVAAVFRLHIMRFWSNERIGKFCMHLLGIDFDRAQLDGINKIPHSAVLNQIGKELVDEKITRAKAIKLGFRVLGIQPYITRLERLAQDAAEKIFISPSLSFQLMDAVGNIEAGNYSVKCWKCEEQYQPKPEDLKRWAESGASFEPTDWECPSCKAAEGEHP